MIVIMDMASGEWTMERDPGDGLRAAPQETREHAELPRLGLQEVAAAARHGPEPRYDFPPPMALMHRLARR